MKQYDFFLNYPLENNIHLMNMTDDFFSFYLYQKFLKESKNILIVLPTLFDANKLYNSLINFTDKVYLFPMDDFLTSEALAISPDLMMNRLETIHSILNEKGIILTNLMGYLRFLPSKERYINCILNLKVGDTLEPSSIISLLVSCGYHKETIVNKTGEFGVRGFILDVFPTEEEYPIRIEFFDDEIESIRYFDPETQKSIESISSIEILPFTEFLYDFHKEIESNFIGKQKYLPLVEDVVNILDYLGDCFTFYVDYSSLKSSSLSIVQESFDYQKENDMDFHSSYMFSFEEIKPSYLVYVSSLNSMEVELPSTKDIDFNIKSIPSFHENEDAIHHFLDKNLKEGKTIFICLTDYKKNSFQKHIHFPFVEKDFSSYDLNTINFIDINLLHGFTFEDFVFLSSFELFHTVESKKKYTSNFKYSTTLHDIKSLEIGDYVVHYLHGIGIYNGIKSITSNQITKDYLEVLYQDNDKIYIPVEKIDLLSKYSARDGFVPTIHKLGGNEWKKTKARVQSKVVDMANQLIQLYAERDARKGFAFSKDSDYNREFEKNIPFVLTPDQVRAIFQIKEDMESSHPMDRLLCGDVGFGKTEVAFVAAFKAIMDSKQVLLLCPTTILSKQHYDNALVRFQNFPVNIALLNRFTSSKDTSRILAGLKDGTIDFVIGTHRLLSDDIYLKDLGLLIIDEEQRFGVRHKEKIKQYKTNIDVLTLTATPIPRTLQMSLSGIRSLSLIETPPVNRFPVQTYVVEENRQIMKDAIYKELSRKGQVFILYNRVQSIQEFALKIQNIAPDARIGVAHGQMNKYELEKTIMDFVQYQFDILVCTTIIETGIDIPNVNTLIILDADHFGLSQLYQIRGRVGRSDKFAYAYLMYQPFKTLTETAIKRLNVIKQFTELGSGFSIATRDLSIRGAGNLLGSEQAGFIDSIGIDLYLKMLQDEVDRRKGLKSDDDEDDSNKALINVATHIDEGYVVDDELKIEIHRMINTVHDHESFQLVKEELEDRFGKISEDLIIYMYEEWFEKLAKKLMITHVHQTKNSIELVFPKEVVDTLNVDEIFMESYQISNMFRFSSKGTNLIIILDIIKLDRHPIYYLVSLLDMICSKYQKNVDLILDNC